MKYSTLIVVFISLLVAEDNSYCTLSDVKDNSTILSSREFYNIGDIISEEDQVYPHSVCHSDGYYDVDSTFRLSDYSGDIIFISMNATW